MISEATVKRIHKSDKVTLRDLRLKLVAENPYIFGETLETESKHDLEYYERWIARYRGKDAAMFILYVGDLAVGMCAVKREEGPSIGYFGSLGVLKEYQGKGYGRLLLDFRLNWVRANTEFKKIKTIITKENTKMLEIAKKQGFIIVGDGYYNKVPEFYLEKLL